MQQPTALVLQKQDAIFSFQYSYCTGKFFPTQYGKMKNSGLARETMTLSDKKTMQTC